jgi:hypothetical protein
MTYAKVPSRSAWVSLLLFAACWSNQSKTTDAGTDAGSDTGVDAGPTLNLAWDWTGIVGTGQSLSIGGLGLPIRLNTQLYNNLKLALNGAVVPPFDSTIAALSMVPLTEPIRPTDPGYPSAYPGNIDGETPHTAMADQITRMVMDASLMLTGAAHDYVTAHTVVGESGMPMSVIKKNGVFPPPFTANTGTGARAYDATLFEVAAIARLAAAAGMTYGLGAITLIHGEADSGNLNYADNIFQLYTDYNTDLPPLTGQTTKIPMLVSQQSGVPSNANSGSISSVQQWLVGVQHPGDIICVGPKYQYDYSADPSSHIHMGSLEYEKLGEKMAQVYFERVVLGNDWQPLQPINETISGNTITIQFHVPVPPLVWDDTLPPPHASGPWANGRGFEVTAAGPAQTIDSVEIVAPDTVKITCHNDLGGLAVTVAYAITTDGIARPAGTFRWGHLKDSDPFLGSVTNTTQPNWAVAFSKDLF